MDSSTIIGVFFMLILILLYKNISKSKRLKDAQGTIATLEAHHKLLQNKYDDAKFDLENAQLDIKALEDALAPSQPKPKKNKKHVNTGTPSTHPLSGEDFLRFQTNKIPKELLYPKTDVTDTSHPLYGQKIVITGTFTEFPYRAELAKYLYDVGADIDTSISSRTNYVLVGEDAGWRKMELIQEHNITTLSIDDFLELFPNAKSKFI